MPSKTRGRDEDEDVEMVSSDDAAPSASAAKRKSSKRLSGKQSKSASVEVVESSDDQQTKRGKRGLRGKNHTAPKPVKSAKRGKLAVEDDDDDDDEEEEKAGGGGKAEEEEEEDDEEEEEEGEEYVIEKILKHKTADDGSTQYLIRWEGYKSEDDTWEPESNCNASELVAEYWKGVPTHKQPRKMQEVQKKLSKLKSPRKKKSGGETNTPASSETEGEAEEVANTLKEPSEGPARKKQRGQDVETEGEDEEKEDIEAQIEEDKRLLKKWEKKADWEELIKEVTTMERSNDDILRAKLLFKNGDALWVESKIVYKKCPQRMLQFYENHLRFRATNRDFQD